MSTLNVANITDGTDTVATGYVVNGSAKAWVNFNGTGTVAIRDSLNVASLTDVGTGNYTVNISSAFANTSVSCPSSSHNTGVAFITSPKTEASTTSTVQHLIAAVTGNAPQVADASINSVAIFGDLA
tara:strand:- start:200 stop:580 length:381 start_codon:yes stop_codon:yes gene_type:complete